jgi:hypothetical protein
MSKTAQKKSCQCRDCPDMHGSGRHAWQWEACMAVGGMHGSGRHAWQWKACMAVEGMHGSGRYTAVGGKGKKGYLSRTALIA